jgi:MFS family permease
MHSRPLAEEAIEREYDPVEVRRSFRLLSLDVIFYLCGLAFIDQSTVLPAFLANLTGSSLLIGAVVAIRPAGVYLPQLWTAHHLRNRTRHKGFLMKVAAISRISIAGFAAMLLLAGPGDRGLMLWAFLAMYAAFWFSEGGAGVPWTDLVAKTIPERLRGRLFGFTQFGGGILGLLAGLLISRILAHGGPAYPTNYAILMAVGAFFFAISYAALYGVREPEGVSEEHDGGFVEYLRRVREMLSRDTQLKRLVAIQILAGFMGVSLPFYILYARQVFAINGAMVGVFLTVQVAGSMVSSALAGYLSDRLGPKAAIITSITGGLLAPVLALLIVGGPVWLYGLVFFAVGAVTGSSWIGVTNYLLELAAPQQRRSYIGLLNTANAPTLVLPVIGGLVVQTFSYEAVFCITAVAFFAALVLALSLTQARGGAHGRSGES